MVRFLTLILLNVTAVEHGRCEGIKKTSTATVFPFRFCSLGRTRRRQLRLWRNARISSAASFEAVTKNSSSMA